MAHVKLTVTSRHQVNSAMPFQIVARQTLHKVTKCVGLKELRNMIAVFFLQVA